MVETFRENDLNNMQKSQILQEYLFMERVNAFLEEKLMTLPTYEDKSDQEIECKKAKLDSSDTGSESSAKNKVSILDGSEATMNHISNPDFSNPDTSNPNTKTQENKIASSDSKIDTAITDTITPTITHSITPKITHSITHSSTHSITPTITQTITPTITPTIVPTDYHHGRYELDVENRSDSKPLTTEQQNTISCLNQLGIDPINNVDSIQEHLEIIELQVGERGRQLEEENKSLNEKLQELMKGLGEVIKESVGNVGLKKVVDKSLKVKSPVAKTWKFGDLSGKKVLEGSKRFWMGLRSSKMV